MSSVNTEDEDRTPTPTPKPKSKLNLNPQAKVFDFVRLRFRPTSTSTSTSTSITDSISTLIPSESSYCSQQKKEKKTGPVQSMLRKMVGGSPPLDESEEATKKYLKNGLKSLISDYKETAEELKRMKKREFEKGELEQTDETKKDIENEQTDET